MADTFVSFGDALSGSKTKTTLENIKNQAPAVATGLYLIGKDLIPQGSGLLIWFIVALIVGVVFQLLAQKSIAVTVSAAIAFVLWVYGMGGPLDNLIPDFLGPFTSTVLIGGYHLIITSLANMGTIK